MLLSASPTSEPSKYSVQVPAVTSPKEVDVKARISSSAPLTPGTKGFPVVEINRRPSDRSESASMLSPLVSRPTSLPSKYMLNVPAVFIPSEVASKRRISWGVAEIPLTVTLLSKDRSRESESSRAKAKTSGLLTPTSEPSKNRLQFVPSNFKISSSADEIPAIV